MQTRTRLLLIAPLLITTFSALAAVSKVPVEAFKINTEAFCKSITGDTAMFYSTLATPNTHIAPENSTCNLNASAHGIDEPSPNSILTCTNSQHQLTAYTCMGAANPILEHPVYGTWKKDQSANGFTCHSENNKAAGYTLSLFQFHSYEVCHTPGTTGYEALNDAFSTVSARFLMANPRTQYLFNTDPAKHYVCRAPQGQVNRTITCKGPGTDGKKSLELLTCMHGAWAANQDMDAFSDAMKKHNQAIREYYKTRQKAEDLKYAMNAVPKSAPSTSTLLNNYFAAETALGTAKADCTKALKTSAQAIQALPPKLKSQCEAYKAAILALRAHHPQSEEYTKLDHEYQAAIKLAQQQKAAIPPAPTMTANHGFFCKTN